MRKFAKVMLPVIAAVALLVIGTPSSLWAIPVVAPEIDPSSTMAAMALLAGAVMVIRGSRKK
jgi:hypothetical protein